MPRSCWVCSKIDNTIIAIAIHILLISLLRVFRWARASKAKRRNTTANNDNNNHSNNDNNNNSYRSKGDAEEMSTLTASSMPGLPGRGSGVRVPDQDQRPASVPPVLKRPGRKRRPMSRVSLETLKNFGNRIRDGGLPEPVETIEDLRGNQMSITSTGHIHYPRTLPRSSATRKASCISDVMELKDSDCHLARRLVAVGVARPGLTRTGTEPIRASQHISQDQRRRPPRVLDEYQRCAQLYGVGSSGRSSAAPGQPSSCHDGQQQKDDKLFRRRRAVWISAGRCVFCDPTWEGWYCRKCWAQY